MKREEMKREDKERWESQLKPCPFCGGKVSLVEAYWSFSFYIHCKTRSCLMDDTRNYAKPETVVKKWNERALIGDFTLNGFGDVGFEEERGISYVK